MSIEKKGLDPKTKTQLDFYEFQLTMLLNGIQVFLSNLTEVLLFDYKEDFSRFEAANRKFFLLLRNSLPKDKGGPNDL